MIFTILSYFDNLLGPRIFLKIPNQPNYSPQIELVPLVMDLYKQGFFVHNFGGLKTANLIFEIKSPSARGRKENLMITIASPEEYKLELGTFKDILEHFAIQFRSLDHIYKGFYDKSKFLDAAEKHQQIIDFVISFHDILPKEQELYTQKVVKMFSFGLSSAGRDAIIKDLQQRIYQPMQKVQYPKNPKDVIPF